MPENEPRGFLQDKDGDKSSKRLFGLIALLGLVGALVVNLIFGKTADSTIVWALLAIIMTAIGGAASDGWITVFKKPGT